LKSGVGALESQIQTIANTTLNGVAGLITPGNAGYSLISAAPQQTVNEYKIELNADSLTGIQSIQQLIALLEAAPTTQLVNKAGTVTS